MVSLWPGCFRQDLPDAVDPEHPDLPGRGTVCGAVPESVHGKLELCGVFKGYPGMAGMYILKTESREEAEEICRTEPLVAGGYAVCKLVDLLIADRENNYLL